MLGAQNDTHTPSVSPFPLDALDCGRLRWSQPRQQAGVGLEAAKCSVEDEAKSPLGKGGGEQPRHRAAADGPEEHSPLGAGGVHDRTNLVHPLL
jgi:hypothetical protein